MSKELIKKIIEKNTIIEILKREIEMLKIEKEELKIEKDLSEKINLAFSKIINDINKGEN